MPHAILYDCEFLTAPGAPQRFWCGPQDPDPVIVQIGALRLSTETPYEIGDRLRLHVLPPARGGGEARLDPLLTRLTGITEETLSAEGRPLSEALDALDRFSGGARLWSWGKDEFNMIAISCYVAGIAPPIPITRFGNACHLLEAAGIPLDEIHMLRSNTLGAHFGLDVSGLRGHDALDDAVQVARVVQHLLRETRLDPKALS